MGRQARYAAKLLNNFAALIKEGLKMKRILYLVLVIAICSFIAGCVGEIISPIRGATIKPVDSKLNIVQPLKVSNQELKTIKKIVVTPVPETIKNEDDIRIFNTMRSILISELKKSKRFKIISGNTFRDMQNKLGIELDLAVMTQEEAEEAYSKIGRAIGSDGMISISQEAKKINMGKSLLSVAFIGTIDVPMVVILDLSTSKTGKSIWRQEKDAIMSSGGMGIKNMSADELKQMLVPIVKPLTDNFLRFFYDFSINEDKQAKETPEEKVEDVSSNKTEEGSTETQSVPKKLSKKDIRKLQERLTELGYSPGPVDGIWGKKTETALKKFQEDNGLSVTGKYDTETTKKLSVTPQTDD